MQMHLQSSLSWRSLAEATRGAAAVLCLVGLGGCGATPEPRSSISHASGPVLSRGTSLEAVRGVCHAESEQLGWDHQPILLTFATEWDCARCSVHIGAIARGIGNTTAVSTGRRGRS